MAKEKEGCIYCWIPCVFFSSTVLHCLSSEVMTILNFIFITVLPFKNVASYECFHEKMYLALHVLRIYKNVYYFDDFFLPTSYF